MKRHTILLIPEKANRIRKIKLPVLVMSSFKIFTLLTIMMLGYLICDYVELRSIRYHYKQVLAENQQLHYEARGLKENLTEARYRLSQLQDFGREIKKI